MKKIHVSPKKFTRKSASTKSKAQTVYYIRKNLKQLKINEEAVTKADAAKVEVTKTKSPKIKEAEVISEIKYLRELPNFANLQSKLNEMVDKNRQKFNTSNQFNIVCQKEIDNSVQETLKEITDCNVLSESVIMANVSFADETNLLKNPFEILSQESELYTNLILDF